MFPLHQAYEVRSAVLEYIKATFRFREKELNDKFHAFVADPTTGLFRGPYISLKTPFVKADDDERIPLEIKPGFSTSSSSDKGVQTIDYRIRASS